MLEASVVLLVLALGWTGAKLAGHRRALRTVKEALNQRQTFLRKEHPGASGQDWTDFCEAANGLLQKVATLETAQTSQLAQLEATLGSLKEAVLVVDGHNHILLANRSLQDIFPRATEIIDQRLEVVLHSVSFLNYVDAVKQGRAEPHHEIEFVETDETRWVEVTGTPIPALDGASGKWALFVLHDVTRQKRMEHMRKEFVANVSHELRTPLAVIKGYIETLVDGHDAMEIDDRLRFLHTVQRHTDRLNSLLDDLLTLSRLESSAPGLEREAVELRALILSVIDEYRNRPDAAKHHLETQLDAEIDRVLIDPLKLHQVLNNLIDNALKYTPAGSQIRIEAELRSTDNEVEIRVSDDGPGIPEADLPHIFERFYRVEKGRSRERGGTGLGLSIVKHIAALHGGRVRADSVVGQGTTFRVWLPTRATR
jgi:two-component system, OmpR family, phosphate regulon sensor histidine kinase PhoR